MTKCVLIVLSVISAYIGNPLKKKQIAKHICKYSQLYKIDFRWPLSIMYVETKFRHIVKPNNTKDVGIMQIHCPYKTYSTYCGGCDIKKLECNIKQGTKFIVNTRKRCLQKHKHKSPWVRHYNWNSKKHSKKVLDFYASIGGSDE